MNLDAIRYFLNPDSFQPFDLKLANGDIHRITDPYQIAVGKNIVAIVYSDSNRMAHCTPHQVVSIERAIPKSLAGAEEAPTSPE
jgi:hypothetical protein